MEKSKCPNRFIEYVREGPQGEVQLTKPIMREMLRILGDKKVRTFRGGSRKSKSTSK